MPRVNVPVTEVTRAGVVPSEVNGDTTNNHELVHDARAVLVARNSDAAGAHNVTLVLSITPDGQAVTNKTVSIPLSSFKYIGPFPAEHYRQADGKVYINVDHATLRLTAIVPPS